MAMNFKVREAQQTVNATSLGTVASIIGEAGKISFIPANLANTEKRLYLILEKEDGTVDQVVCSKQVSEGLRSKELTLGHVMGFEIKEQASASGEIYNQITMPSANQGLITFNAKDIKVAEYKVEGLTQDKINSLLAVNL